MLRKIGCSLISACALICTNAVAMNHNFAPGITVEYELPKNDPQVFSNYTFWTINATCIIHTQDASNDIRIKALNKKGKINGTTISKGQSLVLTVRNADKMEISADSAAKVELTNLGSHTIKATCST